MKLADLDPKFLKFEVWGERRVFRKVETLAEATGVKFLCPACFKKNGGPVGTHTVICWTPEIPPEEGFGPGRWPMSGSGYHDLTLTPSVQLMGGCNWHGFVTAGEVSTV